MFESLTEKFSGIIKRLKGEGRITENNIQDAIKDVKLSLLEADVNYNVVKNFVEAVTRRALGTEVLSSITPEQQFIKVVHDELINMMGKDSTGIDLSGNPPVVIMMVGLQGSGKTTSTGKLARYLQINRRKPYLVSCDVYRPAAIEQLKKVALMVGSPAYDTNPKDKPVDICKKAVSQALIKGCDVVIIDTAGRLHVDEELMKELEDIKSAVNPKEILFVADAMTGQEAVNIASVFNQRLDITGVVLTKMDGDARGGAALSIRAATGKPIKFVGVGEKMDGFELFHPDRIASRILGMGDVVSLVEKAQEVYDQKKALEIQKKLSKNEFTLEDWLESLKSMEKMGSIEDLIELIPGFSGMKKQLKALGAVRPPEKELKKIIAIINSMTKQERRNPSILNGSRRRRIAEGSGTTVQDVNTLIRQYLEMKKMIKKFNQGGLSSLFSQMMRGKMPFK
ncbi:MAG: signal recognition particle protein [Deltaproteobacteria bacterium]|nr:signal recognition particle protein [Deltaproteobacteria bacterium]